MTDLVVESCDPRERADDIKGLFARNGQQRFEATFERAYRTRADLGLRSWLGQLGGRPVMHVSVSPVLFRQGERTLQCGVMGDLMVEEAQRDFWAPVRLLRTLVADLRKEGRFDFLLTTTTSEAEAVFKAGGYKPFGLLQRFVLPLNRMYLGWSRVRGRMPRLPVRSTDEASPPPGACSLHSGTLFRPEPTDEYYRTRIGRGEFQDGTWLTIDGRTGAAGGKVLLSEQKLPGEIGFADAFWDGDDGLAPLLHAAGRWARGQGVSKLTVSMLAESRAAEEARRAGFVPRAVRSTMLVQKLKDVPAAADLFLTGLSLSSW